MPRAQRARVSHQATALAALAALTIAWTWPLVLHLGTAIPGTGGDNFSFVWNFWWMRRTLGDPALEFFRTTFLFHPFGTTLVDHPHTALPALIGATVLRPLTPVAAHNVVLLACVFGNLACTYALAWDLSRSVRASVLAAVVFGCSPLLAVHLLGHFDLMAAWVLPLFALLLGRALRSGSPGAGVGAGIVAAIAAYTTYYYVVYLGLLAVVHTVVWLRPIELAGINRRPGRAVIAAGLAAVALLLAALAAAIAVTGGTVIQAGSLTVSMLRPQNTLSLMWLFAGAAALVAWMPAVERRRTARWRRARVLTTSGLVAAVFILGASPLVWRAARLVADGEYVTPSYVWRNVPLGVDVAAPLLGHPRHPLVGALSRRAYERLHLDDVEAVGWMGVVPLLLLGALAVSQKPTGPEMASQLKLWRTIGGVFGLVAVGPILMIAGFDTGLRLPAILLRYVPFVANARMPGRAMVGVFLALAVMLALRVSAAKGTWGRPAIQWLAIAIVAFEYWDAPVTLTVLDRPRVYETLATEPAGGVCDVPFGIGDGLSTGSGSQDRRALYFATIHEHPLVGGYVGRMPVDALARYDGMPVTRELLSLSSGRTEGRDATDAVEADVRNSPCRYFVVHRSASDAMRAYVSRLPTRLVDEDAEAQLYRLVGR